MERDDLEALAADALEPLLGAPPPLLSTLAAGLAMAERPVALFATSVGYVAQDLEQGEPPGPLAVLSMRYALRVAAVEGSLVAKLATAESAFWAGVGNALAVVAADRLAAPA